MLGFERKRECGSVSKSLCVSVRVSLRWCMGVCVCIPGIAHVRVCVCVCVRETCVGKKWCLTSEWIVMVTNEGDALRVSFQLLARNQEKTKKKKFIGCRKKFFVLKLDSFSPFLAAGLRCILLIKLMPKRIGNEEKPKGKNHSRFNLGWEIESTAV